MVSEEMQSLRKALAFRCRYWAGRTDIYASYIRDVKCIAVRREPGWFMAERDYIFRHNGRWFIVSQHIAGDKRYSAQATYTVEEVTDA